MCGAPPRREARMAQSDPWIPALLTERAGYLRQGLADRVAEVDEQLQLRGLDTAGLPAVEQPQSPTEPPKGRSRPTRQTASRPAPVNDQEGSSE